MGSAWAAGGCLPRLSTMELVLLVGIVIVVIVGLVILVAALRSIRPKEPEAQVYTPSPTMARTAPAISASSPTSGLTPSVIAEIDRLVAAGQKLHAIKLYRQHTGVGLKEAKDRVEHWSISTTAPHLAAVSHASASATSITSGSPRTMVPASAAAQIDHLLAANQAIQAIKVFREHTGLGLAESKRAIDHWR